MSAKNLSFEDRLNQIKDDFDFLDDWEERYRHIIDLGKNLTPLSENEKTEQTKVRGCASQVWLIEEFDSEKKLIFLRGESDSTLVQGLLAVLLFLYSGMSPKIIIDNPPEPIFKILKLDEALTPNRANGLKAMAKRIVDFAMSVPKPQV